MAAKPYDSRVEKGKGKHEGNYTLSSSFLLLS